MDRNHVRDTVLSTVSAVLAADPAVISATADLSTLRAFNSFRAVEIVERAEEALGVEVDPSELTPANLTSPDSLCAVFERAAGLAAVVPERSRA